VAHPQIAAFPRLAEANAKPTRAIAGQHTLITRTIHDMAYDPVRDEIVVPQFYLQGILTFRGSANGDEAPLRVISGPRTQIANPARIALDPVHNEIYIPMDDRLLVFPRDAQGNVAPSRVIEGPDTQMSAGVVQVDPVNNLIIVGGFNVAGGRGDAARAARGQVLSDDRSGRGGQILIFDRTASGNAKPLRIIRGPNTQIDRINQMAIYPQGRLLVAAMPGRQGDVEPPRVFVGMWSLDDEGDVPPKWTINGDRSTLRKPFAVALNPDHKEIYVTDMRLNGVMTFHVPEVFEPVAP